MSKHTQIGRNGEIIAVKFLTDNGYKICHTNWRSGKKEIDIIAEIDNLVVFVEVKTRSNFTFGYPEEAVTQQKQSLLKSAAQDYYEQCKLDRLIRFDIISILIKPNQNFEILHIKDAFY